MSASGTAQPALEVLGEGCVVVRTTHTQNLRWANSALTTNGDTTTSTMTAIAMDAATGAVSVVSGQVPDVAAATALAEQAKRAVTTADRVDAVQLVDGGVSPDFDAGPEPIDDPATQRMVTTVDVLLRQPEAQFGYAELDRTTVHLATTAGTRYRHAQDTVRLEASARTDDASTWWGANRLPDDVQAVAVQQGLRLNSQSTTNDLRPGRHPVILTPSAVADLLIYLAWSANARDAAEGHNVFSAPGGSTKLGQRLTSRSIRLFADPDHPGLQTGHRAVVEANSSMESVFDNGLPLSACDLISDGRLTNLRASRATGQRFGIAPAYLADNLILHDPAGYGDLDDLVARTDEAVLVNCLWYIREVDPQNLLLTGLTRDGVYRVRDGEIVGATGNFRFNVSVTDLLSRIRDASAPTACLPREWADWFTRTEMPALLIDDFNLSSPSEAM
jgi:predicted Zn-dependent protease